MNHDANTEHVLMRMLEIIKLHENMCMCTAFGSDCMSTLP